MNKKNLIKNIIKYIIIFIVILVFNLIIMDITGDETWNFGFSYNISNGLIPYKDFNLVITPLFPFIMSIPLHIFGTNILVFDIVWAIIMTLTSYLIFNLIKEKGWIVFLSYFFIFPIIYPNYNLFIYSILIFIIWVEKNNKSDYLIGFLLALSVLTKQSVGLCLLLPSLIYLKTPKKILKRFIGFIIPIIIFVIYLYVTGAMNDFIDLCILGLFDFAESNGNFINIYVFLTIILLIIILIFIKKTPTNIYNYYALAFLSINIPLFDIYHFYISLSFFLVVLFLNYDIKIPLNLKLFTFGIIIIISFIYIQDKLQTKVIYPNNINKYEYRFISYDEIIFINKFLDFMDKNSNKKIINFTSYSYFSKIVTNQKINKLDLINRGNWGYNGSKKILDEIKKNKDAIFIINEESLSHPRDQIDKNALKYIISNGKKIGTINQKNMHSSIYIFEK